MRRFGIIRSIPGKDGNPTPVGMEIRNLADGLEPTAETLGSTQEEADAAIELPANYDTVPHVILNGAFVPDINAAEKTALENLGLGYDSTVTQDVRTVAAFAITMIKWIEVQDYKRNTAAIDGLGALARAKRIPFLTAYSTEKGITLAQALSQAEGFLWDIVRKGATYDARYIVKEQAIKAATTAEQKIAISEQANWENANGA